MLFRICVGDDSLSMGSSKNRKQHNKVFTLNCNIFRHFVCLLGNPNQTFAFILLHVNELLEECETSYQIISFGPSSCCFILLAGLH
jgi:hypothetical protein